MKTILNTFWKFGTIRILMDQLQNLVFLSCSPIKLWCFPFRIGWKNQLVMTRRFGWAKHAESIRNLFIGSFAQSKFQCIYQKLDYTITSYAISLKFPIDFLFGYAQYSTCQLVPTHKFEIWCRVTTISNYVLLILENQIFDWSFTKFDFISCPHNQLWGLWCRPCWKKTKPVVTEKF